MSSLFYDGALPKYHDAIGHANGREHFQYRDFFPGATSGCGLLEAFFLFTIGAISATGRGLLTFRFVRGAISLITPTRFSRSGVVSGATSTMTSGSVLFRLVAGASSMILDAGFLRFLPGGATSTIGPGRFFRGGATSTIGPGRFFRGGATSTIGPGFLRFVAILILLIGRCSH